MERTVETLIVGAGPAGLAVAGCLRARQLPFEILEKSSSVGFRWHGHYERLHLHTAKDLSNLPGLPFPDSFPLYPSRAQVVEYLESYATHFALEPHFEVEAQRIVATDSAWTVTTPEDTWTTERVILATGYNQIPVTPTWAGQDSFRGSIEHSITFRSGRSWTGRKVLVVGAGNSGAEIALDLCEHGAETCLSVRSPQHVVPRDILGMPTQRTTVRLRRLPRFLRDAIGLTVSRLTYGDLSRFGIERPERGPITRIEEEGKVPLIDVGTIAKIRSGDITVFPGIDRFVTDGVLFTDGRQQTLDHVVLATGYRPGLDRLVPGIEAHLDQRHLPMPRSGEVLPSLFVIGFENTPLGLLYRIAQEAEALAEAIAA